jgi:hypothetical protein
MVLLTVDLEVLNFPTKNPTEHSFFDSPIPLFSKNRVERSLFTYCYYLWTPKGAKDILYPRTLTRAIYLCINTLPADGLSNSVLLSLTSATTACCTPTVVYRLLTNTCVLSPRFLALVARYPAYGPYMTHLPKTNIKHRGF